MKKSVILFCIFFLCSTFVLKIYAQTPKTETITVGDISFEMVFVKGGKFIMGNDSGEDDEKPPHDVELDDFWIGQHEVTVLQYRTFCDATGRQMVSAPKWSYIDDNPVVNVNWFDALAYCEWLSQETKNTFRLPTEAEWEYAAKGGRKSRGYKDGNYYRYAGSDFIEEVAWYKADEMTKSVGAGDGTGTTYMPNELEIYDMSGNVWEWCMDYYGADYYSRSIPKNPKGPVDGLYRVQRGGSWANEPHKLRVTYRVGNIASSAGFTDGFRVVMVR